MKIVPLKLRRFFKEPPCQPMDSSVFVFCHIPRTGGSSIWHQLARFSGNGLNVYDLFHETGLRYGGELNSTRTVLSEDCGNLATPKDYRLVVHHHAPIRIGDIFQVRRPVYFTYLRDPLSRFVSELRWNAQLFGQKSLIDMLRNDALIKPYLSFYLNWFWSLMCRDTNDMPWRAEFNQSEKLEILDFVYTNFALIGFELGSPGNKGPLAATEQKLVELDGMSERARFHEKLATLLDLQAKQLDSEWHYRGTVSSNMDSIPGLMDPAFLDALKRGMKDDYWLIDELRKMRLKGGA